MSDLIYIPQLGIMTTQMKAPFKLHKHTRTSSHPSPARRRFHPLEKTLKILPVRSIPGQEVRKRSSKTRLSENCRRRASPKPPQSRIDYTRMKEYLNAKSQVLKPQDIEYFIDTTKLRKTGRPTTAPNKLKKIYK